MPAFILKRLGLALLVALAVSVIAFGLVRLSGDVATAIAGEGAGTRTSKRPPGLWSRSAAHRPVSRLALTHPSRRFRTSLYFKTDVIDLVMDSSR